MIARRLGDGGRLPGSIARPFAAAYGTSFDDVRLHEENPVPAQFGVDALTVGTHVAFAPGRYQPGTRAGQRLIGHELAHVAQQRAGGGRLAQGGPSRGEADGYEREASAAADAALAGRRAHISGAPLGPYGGSAGGCFIAGLDPLTIGDLAHAHIQSYFTSAGHYAEVVLPGARYVDSDRPHASGRCDLLAAVPPVVPNVPQPYIRPAAYMTSPPAPAPGVAAIGEIKPISYLGNPDGVNQLLDYIDAHNRYYGGGAFNYAPITFPLLTPPPAPLITGDPTFIPWPPQALHVVGAGGMYYYFCRPLGELVPIMRYLKDVLQEHLRKLNELLKKYPELRPQLEPVLEPLRQAAEAAARAQQAAQRSWLDEHFWEVVLVLAVLLVVVVFAAEIFAAIAAVVEAVLAAWRLITALSAALAALLAFLGQAQAQPNQPPPEPPPQAPPDAPPQQPPPPRLPPVQTEPLPGPGCFTGSTLVTMADGTHRRIENVAVGDPVLAWCEETGSLEARPVLQLHRHPPEPLLRVELEDGRVVEVTHFHTMRTPTAWVLSGDLKPGMSLLVQEGDALRGLAVADVTPLGRLEPVYNLSVEEFPTYLAADVVVHNTGMAKPQRLSEPRLISQAPTSSTTSRSQ